MAQILGQLPEASKKGNSQRPGLFAVLHIGSSLLRSPTECIKLDLVVRIRCTNGLPQQARLRC